MIRDPSDGSVKSTCKESLQVPVGYAALKAKHGENWGIKAPEPTKRKPSPAPTIEQLRNHYATHNLGFQPKEQGEL